MFQHSASVLRSEIKSLGHPRAALRGFTVSVLAYNVLAGPAATRRRKRPLRRTAAFESLHRPLPTTWPSTSKVAMRACSSPCPPGTGLAQQSKPRRHWPRRCCFWLAAFRPSRWSRAYEAPRSSNQKVTPIAASLDHKCQPPASSSRLGPDDLERGDLESDRLRGSGGARSVASFNAQIHAAIRV